MMKVGYEDVGGGRSFKTSERQTRFERFGRYKHFNYLSSVWYISFGGFFADSSASMFALKCHITVFLNGEILEVFFLTVTNRQIHINELEKPKKLAITFTAHSRLALYS